MKSQLTDKLVSSVREAKQQQAETAKPTSKVAKPTKSETRVRLMPAKRVWPD